ncbi:MAG: hypothetical protein OEV08_11185 [Nitrospira sp.]|nr:hypothetical protein [Nitrospira sp.]
MKVTLDLDHLLERGEITQLECERFKQLAAHGTASLAFNVLIGFGVIAVSGASLALLPTAATAITLGLVVSGLGMGLISSGHIQWKVLANICVLVGALMVGGGIAVVGKGSLGSLLLIAAAFTGAGILARSGLLITLAVFALSACIGARTWYQHASYFLAIQEPTLTVALFTLLALMLYHLSKHLPSEYEILALTGARTSVVLVNFGFWVGSLWGDRHHEGTLLASSWLFTVVWALALAVTGAWAWSRNRRWVVNVVAVFGAIHFYTQWFERLGASPGSVLTAGVLALVFAIGLRALNAERAQEET